MNIVLVGFMGTGKTAVARALAYKLKRRLVSTDDMIKARERCPITEIFEKEGEAYFRKVEKKVVEEISSLEDVVVDTGGGVVIDEKNVHRLKRTGKVVCLIASVEIILERTSKFAHRPLLNTADPATKIRELLEKRAPFYARADVTIDTSGLSVEEVVERIIGGLNDYRIKTGCN